MTDYKAIHGKNILHVASDLDNAEGEGQIWFNTATSDFKTIVKVSGAWATGGSLNTVRGNFFAGAGTQTAGLAAGGYSGTATLNVSEEYDGSSWTEGDNLNTTKAGNQGVGIQTAALSISGDNSGLLTEVESYNVSSWTETTDVNTARNAASAFGTQTSAILAAGGTPPAVASVESWNGSAWTEIADVNSARINLSGFGATNTDGIIMSGTPNVASAESWNGTTWTEVGDLNTGRAGGATSGSSNVAGIFFGGDSPLTGKTEAWDGSSWTEVADMATARNQMAQGVGLSINAGLAVGGNDSTPTQVNTVEEWDQTSTLSAGAWASGGNIGTPRNSMVGVGTQTAALIAGGEPGKDEVETYDGTSWTEVADITTQRYGMGASGTSTACIAFGGTPAGVAQGALAEKWDGSSWTEVADLNTARTVLGGSATGTSTAALAFGGVPAVTATELWNGTSWSEQPGDMNTGREYVSSSGTSTAAQVHGGGTPPGAVNANTEQYDGSSWTEVADLNTARKTCGHGGGGTQAGSFIGGGQFPPYGPSPNKKTIVEMWDGSSWTEVADLPTNLASAGLAGDNTTGLLAGGIVEGVPGHVASFEWTVAQNVKTITD